jgi:hypothetical protein
MLHIVAYNWQIDSLLIYLFLFFRYRFITFAIGKESFHRFFR